RAGDQRLNRFRPCLGVENLEVEPMLLEDAAALTKLGKPGIPGAALRYRDFEEVVSIGTAEKCWCERESAERRDKLSSLHGVPPEELVVLFYHRTIAGGRQRAGLALRRRQKAAPLTTRHENDGAGHCQRRHQAGRRRPSPDGRNV